MPDAAGMSLDGLLGEARLKLASSGISTPALDARLIVEHFSGTRTLDAVLRPQRAVDPSAVEAVREAVERRLAGEPVHRILGYREFYGLRLALSPDTLEPRPDTETLVDAVLPFLREVAVRSGEARILDLGTGTGAIALALLAQVEQAVAIGTDLAPGALACADANAAAHGLQERFATVRSHWFGAITGKFHAIVSNPPYIRTEDIESLQREVRDFDPPLALDGGEDGLQAYQSIAQGAKAHLEDDGMVAVEIGHDQRAAVTALFEQEGYRLALAQTDLAGQDRVLAFRT